MFVVFNYPQPPAGGTSRQWTTFLLECFKSAVPSSRVTGAMYHWSDINFTDKLSHIHHDRSLRFHIAAGDKSHDVPDRVSGFFDSLNDSFDLKVRPYQMRNHNKWFVFDEFDFVDFEARTHWTPVMQSASPSPALFISTGNLSDDDLLKHNAAVIMPISEGIATSLRDRFEIIKTAYLQTLAVPYLRESVNRYETSETDLIKVYQFPRKPFRQANDTVRSILENVEHFSEDSRDSRAECTIRIVTPRWKDDRLAVAKALTTIHGHGGTIEVVARGRDKKSDQDGDGVATPELGTDVAKELKKCSTRYFESKGVTIHTKYMLIDAPYIQPDGTFRRERLVWVGTPNLTKANLSGSWETLVKLKEATGAFDRFLADFEYLKANATQPARVVGQ